MLGPCPMLFESTGEGQGELYVSAPTSPIVPPFLWIPADPWFVIDRLPAWPPHNDAPCLGVEPAQDVEVHIALGALHQHARDRRAAHTQVRSVRVTRARGSC